MVPRSRRGPEGATGTQQDVPHSGLPRVTGTRGLSRWNLPNCEKQNNTTEFFKKSLIGNKIRDKSPALGCSWQTAKEHTSSPR